MSATTTTTPKLTPHWWEVGQPGTGTGATAQATPALGATKTDTGASGYAGNPWANYNTPQDNAGFNYTQDQYYNAAADRPQWDLAQTGDKSETDRARVWRWTLDALKAKGLDPGKADQATVQRAYLANIGRLKRDYQANGMNWQGSAYAGYDQFLGGQGASQGGATQQGGQRGGDQGTGWQYTPGTSAPNGGWMNDQGSGATTQTGGASAAQTQGGGIVDPTTGILSPLVQGLGSLAGNGVIQTTGQTAGQGAERGPAASSTPTGVPTTPTTTNPTGNATPMGGFYKDDPSLAVNQFLAQHNIGVTNHSPFADFLRKVANAVVPSMISVMPAGPNGQTPGDRLNNLPQMITDMLYGNGGQMFGNLNTFAGQALGAMQGKLGGMPAPDVEALLKTINGLRSLGQNPYTQSFNQTALNDLIQQYGLVGGQQAAAGQTPATPDWLTNPQNDIYSLFR